MYNMQLHLIIIAQFITTKELLCVTLQMIKHGATFNMMNNTIFVELQIGFLVSILIIDGI
jgi:hypothetical protein